MKQAKAMTDEALRIRVAELCGWTELDTESEYIGFSGKPPKSYGDYDSLELPDYPNDLNAMHEAECNTFMIMGARGDWSRYVTILSHVIDQLPLPKNLNERYVQKWIGENHAPFRILYAKIGRAHV